MPKRLLGRSFSVLSMSHGTEHLSGDDGVDIVGFSRFASFISVVCSKLKPLTDQIVLSAGLVFLAGLCSVEVRV